MLKYSAARARGSRDDDIERTSKCSVRRAVRIGRREGAKGEDASSHRRHTRLLRLRLRLRLLEPAAAASIEHNADGSERAGSVSRAIAELAAIDAARVDGFLAPFGAADGGHEVMGPGGARLEECDRARAAVAS